MKKSNQYTLIAAVVSIGLILCVLLLVFAGKEAAAKKKPVTGHPKQTEEQTQGQIVNLPTQSESIVTRMCVISALDSEDRTITLFDVEYRESKTFYMKYYPTIYTEYGNPTTIDQIYPGLVVDATYEENSKHLTELSISNKVTGFRGVTGLTVNYGYRTMSFYNHVYGYKDDVIIAAGDFLLTPQQISDKDLVTVYSTSSEIVSIVIDRGHGYLNLTGAELFEGGYLTIGGDIVKTVVNNMMVMVPEGDYKVSVSHNGFAGSKYVKIMADTVSVVDFSEITRDTTLMGTVYLRVPVWGATVYIDDEEVDYTDGILTLPVGDHKLKVVAKGYGSYRDVLHITTEHQSYTVEMEPVETESEETEPETTTREDATTENEKETYVSAKNRVYIDGPEGALIYFDETYLGVAPLSFALVTGQHTIIVLKGTSVKQYVVTLAEGPDDVRYDFTPKE